MNASKLRISLTIITFAGAYHLDSAWAVAPTSQDSCVDYAIAFASAYCDGKNGQWTEVRYTCNPDGTASVKSVACAF